MWLMTAEISLLPCQKTPPDCILSGMNMKLYTAWYTIESRN